MAAHSWVVGCDDGTKDVAKYPTANINDGYLEPSKMTLHVTQNSCMKEEGGQDMEYTGGESAHTIMSSPASHSASPPRPSP